MRRLLVAFAAVALLVPALVLPAAAATKTIPATAFKPFANYPPELFAIVTVPGVVFIMDADIPTNRAIFWAEVRIPVGAKITRVNYWYMDTAARGTKLSLRSGRWGSSTSDTKAEIVTADAASELTKVSTSAIVNPKVTAGEMLTLFVELPQDAGCGGVKIDYTP